MTNTQDLSREQIEVALKVRLSMNLDCFQVCPASRKAQYRDCPAKIQAELDSLRMKDAA